MSEFKQTIEELATQCEELFEEISQEYFSKPFDEIREIDKQWVSSIILYEDNLLSWHYYRPRPSAEEIGKALKIVANRMRKE